MSKQNKHSLQLDRYDRRILQALQAQGRMSNQELAALVGLSPSPCLRRVKALEQAGVIEGYHAVVNAKQVDLDLMVLIQIAMDKHTPERFQAFEAAIRDIPEVQECLLITGQEADYQLKVMVQDLDAYQKLLLHRITRIPGVTGVHSSFVLSQVLDRKVLPLD